MTNNIPEHLKELDCSTPSSWRKLIAAWEGLHVETQILFLKHIKKHCSYNHVRNELYKVAFNSENAYIRYLAAMELRGEDEEESDEIEKKIKNDSSSLVKYSLYECNGLGWRPSEIEENLKLFWKVPHEARLALVRTDSKYYHIYFLLKILQESIDSKIADKIITWDEIDEILSDFVSQPGFIESFESNDLFHDGMLDYDKAEELKKLWLIVSILPDGAGTILLKNLPVKTSMFFELSEEILRKLSEYNLEKVLCRKDVGLTEFRKKLFHDSQITEEIKCAAINCNFSLDIDEFVHYLNQLKTNAAENILSLSDLGYLSSNLCPWLYRLSRISCGSSCKGLRKCNNMCFIFY